MTTFHRQNAKLARTKSENIFDACQKEQNTATRARKVEVQTALFIAKNNLPLAISDDLITFIKHLDNDKHVQGKLSCDQTKCTAIVKNVIGRYSFENLVQTLKNQKFSLIIDESTDISTTKNLVMVVRFNSESGVRDEFLALLEVSYTLHLPLVHF